MEWLRQFVGIGVSNFAVIVSDESTRTGSLRTLKTEMAESRRAESVCWTDHLFQSITGVPPRYANGNPKSPITLSMRLPSP